MSRRTGRIGILAAIALAAAVLAVVLLVRTPSAHVATTTHPVRSTRPVGPAVISPSAVVTPLALRALPIARYCNGSGLRLVPCRPGQRPVTHQPQRMIELSFIARRPTGAHSWYAWSLAAPHGCLQASNGGPTAGPVSAGTRLEFDDLIPPGCHGVLTAVVSYITQAPAADRERGVAVGRATVRLL